MKRQKRAKHFFCSNQFNFGQSHEKLEHKITTFIFHSIPMAMSHHISCLQNYNATQCSCKATTGAKHRHHQSKHNPVESDYWPVNPCHPWVSSVCSGSSYESNSQPILGMPIESYPYDRANSTDEKCTRKLLSAPAISRSDDFPGNTLQKKSIIQNNPVPMPSYSIVGHPALRICKFKLPNHLLPLLQLIVEACQEHSLTLSKGNTTITHIKKDHSFSHPWCFFISLTGWKTYLYSLTKQDIAIRDIHGLYEVARPIVSYVKRIIESVYGAQAVRIDRNQPHVLKYSAKDGHLGVELHHDKCDLTANIMLSKSCSYSGGG